jgi:hypothetical protein
MVAGQYNKIWDQAEDVAGPNSLSSFSMRSARSILSQAARAALTWAKRVASSGAMRARRLWAMPTE